VGALFTVWSPIYAQAIFKGRPDIAYGVLLILIMYLMPQGVIGGFNRLLGLRRGVRQRVVAVPSTPFGPVTAGVDEER